MSITEQERPATAPRAATRPATTPQRLHHLAYMTQDTAATVEFYTRVLGMPLVNAVVEDHIPSTGAPQPYFHSFFRMGTGETLAFFECPGIPPAAPKAHPIYNDFEHVAMEVPSRADCDRWQAWLEQNGLEVATAEHGIIYSIYFRDPVNGIRLEITTTLDPAWNDQGEAAWAALQAWTDAKRKAEAEGRDITAALQEHATAHSAAARRERDAIA